MEDDSQRLKRFQELIHRIFLRKSGDYRFGRAFVATLHHSWQHSSPVQQEEDVDVFFQILLSELAQAWSEPALIRQGNVERTTLLARSICVVLSMLSTDQQHILTEAAPVLTSASASASNSHQRRKENALAMICRGVSSHFDSAEPTTRYCGMAVGVGFARIMGQSLSFDEFIDPFPEPDEPMVASSARRTQPDVHTCATPQTDEEMEQLRAVVCLTQAPDFNDMASILDFFDPEPSLPVLFQPMSVLRSTVTRERDNDTESDSSELVPYDDAEDTIEDLRQVPKPKYLQMCLESTCLITLCACMTVITLFVQCFARHQKAQMLLTNILLRWKPSLKF